MADNLESVKTHRNSWAGKKKNHETTSRQNEHRRYITRNTFPYNLASYKSTATWVVTRSL